jgi:peptidoglycan/LPS O-acetylase OafA/YrhL
VAWTLTIEVLFYAVVPLLALTLRRRSRAIRAERLAGWIVASYLASVVFTVMGGLSGVGNTAVWLRVVFPAAWQMFCPGILLALAPHLQSQAWKRWLIELPQRRSALAVAAVLMVAAALLNAAAPLSHGVRVFQLLTDASRPMFAIAFGIVLAAAIRARPWFQRRGRWVLHLGLVSYGIYLFHAVILDAFFYRGVNLTPLPHDGLLAYGVHLVFLVALTIPVAMVSWRWFEQPLIRLAGTLSKRWRARGELARAPSAVP